MFRFVRSLPSVPQHPSSYSLPESPSLPPSFTLIYSYSSMARFLWLFSQVFLQCFQRFSVSSDLGLLSCVFPTLARLFFFSSMSFFPSFSLLLFFQVFDKYFELFRVSSHLSLPSIPEFLLRTLSGLFFLLFNGFFPSFPLLLFFQVLVNFRAFPSIFPLQNTFFLPLFFCVPPC